MSATLDAGKFQDYFEGAPLLVRVNYKFALLICILAFIYYVIGRRLDSLCNVK